MVLFSKIISRDTPLPAGPCVKEKAMILERCGVPASTLVIENNWVVDPIPPPKNMLINFVEYMLVKEEDYTSLRRPCPLTH